MPKRKIALSLFGIAILINIFICLLVQVNVQDNPKLVLEVKTDRQEIFQIFYGNDLNFSEEFSMKEEYKELEKLQKLSFEVPLNNHNVRIDFGEKSSKILIGKVYFQYKNKRIDLPTDKILNADQKNMISSIDVISDGLEVTTNGNDPFIVFSIKDIDLNESIVDIESDALLVKKIIICVSVNLLFVFVYLNAERLLKIPLDIYQNRKLIFYLSKNDFKTKFAGSYFGIFWAFVQPVITIVLYWFVFQVGLRSSSMNEVPFVLWLIAGLVPWFYYSDVISSVTNCFLEYSYLVKKVVFNISILPVVKIISALFIHLFFIFFTVLVYTANGYMPSIYTIQLLYYTLCMIALVLSLSYITSSLVLFFRDLGQIINIYLQIAMWMTPIMWNYSMLPDKYLWIFKLNPMYYIVEGYRDSLINNVWFFDKLNYTIYFWGFAFGLFVIGTTIFKRLRPHFSDVI
jgi:teichoic acid transport system permease protein